MPLRNVDDETIAEALEKLVGDGVDIATSVILEPESSPPCNYYVQFAVQEGTLFCEAVSNEYLDPPCRLDDEQLRMLEELGWGPPETKGQNWFRTFQPTSPQEYEEVVRLAHRALHDVYHLPEDVPINMTTSWKEEGISPHPLTVDYDAPIGTEEPTEQEGADRAGDRERAAELGADDARGAGRVGRDRAACRRADGGHRKSAASARRL